MSDTEKEFEEIEKRFKGATEGPYAWSYIGEKTNGYIIGLACDEQGNLLSGCLDQYEQDEDVVETILYKSTIGEHEASTCNYGDAEFLSHAWEDIKTLLAAYRKQEERVRKLEYSLDKFQREHMMVVYLLTEWYADDSLPEAIGRLKMKFEQAEADLKLNASMFAKQCDLAREAKASNKRLRRGEKGSWITEVEGQVLLPCDE